MRSTPLTLGRLAVPAACLAMWMVWPAEAQQASPPPPQQRRVTPSPPSGTGRRLALLIGNKDYARKPLANPVNDATDLAAALRSLGFEATLAVNLTRLQLDRSVREFAGRIQPGDVALFYFSGHGMEVEGQNYLLPVDFDAQAEVEVRYQAMPASLVQEDLQSHGARVAILILDACRDNPYRSWRSQAGGLVGMSGSGVYVAFAAASGRTAEDNPRERNGLFTKSLLAVVDQPGLGIDDVFNQVRQRVAAESGGSQVPFSNSGLIGGFAFREAASSPVAPDVEAEYWAECKERGGSFCQAYLDTYPQGGYVRLARAMLEPKHETSPTPEVIPPTQIAAGTTKVNPKDGLTYVWIPPGTFQMGCSPGDTECQADEKPAHQVTITRGFWLGQTPVTQQAYQRVIGKNPSHFKGADLPVESVTRDESQAYCAAIGGRLPTEAEWEYAARAGTTGARYGNLDDIAWYDANSGSQTHEVGQKRANAFGLYDMLGNICQWVADWYGRYQSGPQSDPFGSRSGGRLRGGSWKDHAGQVRASVRVGFKVDASFRYLGLRCAGDWSH